MESDSIFVLFLKAETFRAACCKIYQTSGITCMKPEITQDYNSHSTFFRK